MNYPGKAVRPAALVHSSLHLVTIVVAFVLAGIQWWQGWLFLAIFVLEITVVAVYIRRTSPEIYVARGTVQKGSKGWDLVFFHLSKALVTLVFPVAGLDRWSAAPWWVIVLGYVMLTVGMAGATWVMRVNKFAEMTVRIQTERAHQVVDTGPYAFVRHPFYVAASAVLCGMPLALGSYWATIPAGVVVLGILVRTALEDRVLQDELPGYKEYISRVRYRLVPGVW
jgi:protein-S-isoprenylcysteine O-methyltransferase Ste14